MSAINEWYRPGQENRNGRWHDSEKNYRAAQYSPGGYDLSSVYLRGYCWKATIPSEATMEVKGLDAEAATL